MKSIDVHLRIPTEHRQRAIYAFGYFATHWGRPVRYVDEARDAHIVYGPDVPSLGIHGGRVCVPYDARSYQANAPCRVGSVDGRAVWGCGINDRQTDLVGGAFRLLALLDEQQIPAGERDDLGLFHTGALPSERRRMLAEPLADNHASCLLTMACGVDTALLEPGVPRWPHGRKAAVCVSHDTDAVRLGQTLEFITLLAKVISRRKRAYARALLDSWRSFWCGGAGDPYWSFADWQSHESGQGIKSCFYLAIPPLRCGRHIHDCKSTVADRGTDWALLRSMREQGWEFGLHPAIRAGDDAGELRAERGLIEQRLSAPVTGIRHHYLAFDQKHPWRTFRNHLEAGFDHDSSVGWRDAPGFRAGTALPYFPYDASAEQSLPLIELPLIIMDGHITEGGPEAVVAASQVAERTIAAGGLLMLNWHTQGFAQSALHSGCRNALDRVLAPLLHDSQCWFATPGQIARWWRDRDALVRGNDGSPPGGR